MIACVANENGDVSFDLIVCDVSCFVCQIRCVGGDNSWDMVACLWVCERAL